MLAIIPVVFFMMRAAPGNPYSAERMLTPAVEANLKASLGLDKPLHEQYFEYLGNVIQGDLGPSMVFYDKDVSELLGEGLPVSLTIGGLAFLLALGVGIPLGFHTAIRRGRWPDHAGSLLAITAICVPTFVAGPLLVMALAVKLRWFPVALWDSPWHAVLPVVTLGIYFGGRVARLMREGMLNTLDAAFLVTARLQTLPVRIYAEATFSLENTVNAISTIFILLTVALLVLVNRLMPLDRVWKR